MTGVEAAEKGVVREVPQAQAIVSHGIGGARHAIMQGNTQLQWVRPWSCRGGGALPVPADICGVIRPCPHCLFSGIQQGRHNMVVCDIATQFQIAVGDGAVWIGEQCQVLLDGSWEGKAPQPGFKALWPLKEECTSHPCLCHVAGSDNVWLLCQDDPLHQACGPCCQVGRQGSELAETVVHCFGDAEPGPLQILVAECFLEEQKESTGSGHCQGHGAEFSKHLVPVLGWNVARCGWNRKDLLQPFHLMRGKVDGPFLSVDDPPQHGLLSCPCGVAFQQFLD